MLEQLVESRNHTGETRRRGGFLLSAFTVVFSLLTFALLYSLFSYNLATANERLDISALVAPANPPETTPPAPEQSAQPRGRTSENAADRLPTRAKNIQNINEPPLAPPEGVSSERDENLARPQSAFTLGETDSSGSFSGNEPAGRGDKTTGGLTAIRPAAGDPELVETTPPPVVKKAETKPPAPKPVVVAKRSQILNGEAISLVKPTYPQPAKLVRAAGAVNVQVTIDENGSVISANAVSGHPLLRQVSEQAARASKFSPTVLNGQKVKVTGLIVYNFVAQ